MSYSAIESILSELEVTTNSNLNMKTIDKSALKDLRVEIDAALKVIADRHGISLTAGNASYTTNTATFKLHLSLITADGLVISPEAERFLQYATFIGLQPTDMVKPYLA